MFFRKDKKEKFWNWFTKNKSDIEVFINQSDHNDYSIYHTLSDKIKKVHPDLIPEITMEGEEFILIISCDGKKEGIKSVQELAEVAPEISNWIIKKFRQPSDKITLNYDGLKLEMNDLKVSYEFDLEREKVDIEYLLKGFDDSDDRYKILGFLYLDHVLGEFNVMTRVGYIDFEKLEEDSPSLVSLVELRKLIEQKLY